MTDAALYDRMCEQAGELEEIIYHLKAAQTAAKGKEDKYLLSDTRFEFEKRLEKTISYLENFERAERAAMQHQYIRAVL